MSGNDDDGTGVPQGDPLADNGFVRAARLRPLGVVLAVGSPTENGRISRRLLPRSSRHDELYLGENDGWFLIRTRRKRLHQCCG